MRVRKKPVEVEARQVTEFNIGDIAEWCFGRVLSRADNFESYIVIPTLEGSMRGNIGDWIIKGVNGEFYPCKSSIFEKTYDIIEDEIVDFTFPTKTLEIVSIVDQPDGSAIVSFDMDNETMKLFAEIGIKKVIMDSVEETLK